MKRTIYTCDICNEEIGGVMFTLKLTTNIQGTDRSVDLDSCAMCRDGFFELRVT